MLVDEANSEVTLRFIPEVLKVSDISASQSYSSTPNQEEKKRTL